MWLNFFGADQSYHLARKLFVYKGLLPACEMGLLDRPHHYTVAERHDTGEHVEFVAGHITGWHDNGQTTRGDSGGRAHMTAAILDGRLISAEIKAEVRAEVCHIVEKQGQAPGLAIVRVGSDAASGVYSKALLRMAEEVGVTARLEQLPVHTSADELRALLLQLN